jgi:Protein-disulfide isomerase
MTEDQFDKCIINEKNEELVLKSRIEGTKKYNVNATPTIIINGKKYTGEYSYKAISKYIETLTIKNEI